jgi:AP-1 complex subunit mu
MSVSALFVLDLKGRVLLSRDYRGDVSLKVAEKFIIRLNELEEAGKVRPWVVSVVCKHCSRGSCTARAAPSRVPTAAAHLQVTPVFFDDGVSYSYITHSNLVLMTVSRTNANAAATLLFLHKLRDILTTYFGELEEESLRDNFVIAYELLDEASPLALWQVQQPPLVLAAALGK